MIRSQPEEGDARSTLKIGLAGLGSAAASPILPGNMRFCTVNHSIHIFPTPSKQLN